MFYTFTTETAYEITEENTFATLEEAIEIAKNEEMAIVADAHGETVVTYLMGKVVKGRKAEMVAVEIL